MKHFIVCLSVCCSFVFTVPFASAQAPTPKGQFSLTGTFVSNFDGSFVGGGLVGGAFVLQTGNGAFIRFLGNGGVVNPVGMKVAVGTVRTTILIGVPLSKRFVLLTGAGLAFLFPPTGGVDVTPVGVVSAGFKLGNCVGIFFPTAITKNGIVWNAELVLTIPNSKK